MQREKKDNLFKSLSLYL